MTDGQLLERFATRDGDRSELAFAALVERHGAMVLRVARGILLDEHSAHDAFQATFLILARKARSLWVRDSLGPWLHSVAYRVASHARSLEIRRQARERRAARPELFLPEDRERAELARAIHEEIDRLPQPFRLAVVTCHLEGLTQHDAAQRLGWPVGTLQSRLARGREKLKGRLERRGIHPSLAAVGGSLPSVPHALTITTARAAASLNVGQAITGMIPPTVVAMIRTTTQGMLMTKLKLGATAVVMMVGGIVGTGMTVGVGQDARATDDPPPQAKSAVKANWRPAAPPEPEKVVDPDRLDRPVEGFGFPVLLDFHAAWAGPCRQMRPVVARLVEKGYPIKTIDIDQSPELAEKYQVKAVPTFILVDGSGHVLNTKKGAVTAAELARFYNENRPKPTTPNPPTIEQPPIPAEPPKSPSKFGSTGIPRPGDSLVKIRVEKEGQPPIRFAGTMIQSTAAETLILTSARGFDGIRILDGHFQAAILVDLFGSLKPTIAGHPQTDIPAEFVDIDRENDLALLRIKPGQVLSISRVVNESWNPIRGIKLQAVAESTGAEPILLETVMANPLFPYSEPARPSRTMTIRNVMKTTRTSQPPNPGRAIGGGLFTSDDVLGGVYLGLGPDESGLYARPEAIRALLDRWGLAAIYQQDLVPVPNDNPNAPQTAVELDRPEPQIEPKPSLPANPKPWETVVRVEVHLSEAQWGYASGTVISSTDEESIILTCAHVFRLPTIPGQPPQPLPKDFRVPITVDLFNGQFVSQAPARVGRAEQDLVGEVIDYDFANDVGLIRIRPGKKLPVSRVVPTSWHPSRGMKMSTVGCSFGADPTAWDTTILDPRLEIESFSTSKSRFIKCAHQPNEGRTGGGLFTTDGYLAGLCNYAEPEEHVGLYAVPDAIHRLLDRNGLKRLYDRAFEGVLIENPDGSVEPFPGRQATNSQPLVPQGVSSTAKPPVANPFAGSKLYKPTPGDLAIAPQSPEPAPSSPWDFVRPLTAEERTWMNYRDSRLPMPSPVALADFPVLLYFHDQTSTHESQIREVVKLCEAGYPIKPIDFGKSPDLVAQYQVEKPATFVLVNGQGTRLARLEGWYVAQTIARFYNEKCLKPMIAYKDIVANVDDAPTGRGAVPIRDDRRRIDELEKKLDQVLKALEGLKGGKSPE